MKVRMVYGVRQLAAAFLSFDVMVMVYGAGGLDKDDEPICINVREISMLRRIFVSVVMVIILFTLQGCGYKRMPEQSKYSRTASFAFVASYLGHQNKIIVGNSAFGGCMVIDVAKKNVSRKEPTRAFPIAINSNGDRALLIELAFGNENNKIYLYNSTNDQLKKILEIGSLPSGVIWAPKGDIIAGWLYPREDQVKNLNANISAMAKHSRPVREHIKQIPFLLDTKSGKLTRIGITGYPLSWSKSGSDIYIMSNQGIYLYSVKFGHTMKLRNVDKFNSLFYSDKLDSYITLAYAQAGRKTLKANIARVNAQLGEKKSISSIDIKSWPTAFPDGSKLLYESKNGLSILDIRTKKTVNITGIEGKVSSGWLNNSTIVAGRSDGYFAYINVSNGSIIQMYTVIPLANQTSNWNSNAGKEETKPVGIIIR